jgi:hypothetical protein
MRIVKKNFVEACEWRFFIEGNDSAIPNFSFYKSNYGIHYCGVTNYYESTPEDFVDLIWDHLSDDHKEYLMVNGFDMFDYLEKGLLIL